MKWTCVWVYTFVLSIIASSPVYGWSHPLKNFSYSKGAYAPFPDQPELVVDGQTLEVQPGSAIFIQGKRFEINVEEYPVDRGRVVRAFKLNGIYTLCRTRVGDTYSCIYEPTDFYNYEGTPLFTDYPFNGQKITVAGLRLIGQVPIEIASFDKMKFTTDAGHSFETRHIKLYLSGKVKGFVTTGRNQKITQSGYTQTLCLSAYYAWNYFHESGNFYARYCSGDEDPVDNTVNLNGQVVTFGDMRFHKDGSILGGYTNNLVGLSVAGTSINVKGYVSLAEDGSLTVLQGGLKNDSFVAKVQGHDIQIRDSAFSFYENRVPRYLKIPATDLTAINGQSLKCNTVGMFENGKMAFCVVENGYEATWKINGYDIKNIAALSFFSNGSIREIQTRGTKIMLQGQEVELNESLFSPDVTNPRPAVDQLNYFPSLSSGHNLSRAQVEFYPNQVIKRMTVPNFKDIYVLERANGHRLRVGPETRSLTFDEQGKVLRVDY